MEHFVFELNSLSLRILCHQSSIQVPMGLWVGDARPGAQPETVFGPKNLPTASGCSFFVRPDGRNRTSSLVMA